jgi:hypothetical protein
VSRIRIAPGPPGEIGLEELAVCFEFAKSGELFGGVRGDLVAADACSWPADDEHLHGLNLAGQSQR